MTMEVRSEGAWRYVNAPAPFKDEAPSSWMARVAHAHRLPVEELLHLTSATASELDLGLSERVLAEVSFRSPIAEWPSCHDVIEGLHSAALMPEYRPQVSAAEWWAFCPACFAENPEAVNYVRRAWTHPLAFTCLRHACYLKPRPLYREIRYSDGRTMNRPLAPRILKCEAASEEDLALSRLLFYPARRGWEPTARAVFDLCDALVARTGPNGVDAALLRDFAPAQLLMRFPGSRRLLSAELCAQPAHIRIAMLRIVSSWLSFRIPEGKAAVPSWLQGLVERRRRLHGRDLSWAAADPLFQVMTRLNSWAADQLADRSRAWPSELRARMAGAIVVGAMANSA